MLLLIAFALTVVALVGAQEVPTHAEPSVYMFDDPKSLPTAVAVVAATVVWALVSWFFTTSNDSRVITSDVYNSVRQRVRDRWCGIAPISLRAEFWLDVLFYVFFIVTASIYVLQSMTQFAVIEPGPPAVYDPNQSVLILPGETFWVANVFLLYLPLFIYKISNALFRSLSEFGWSAFLTFIAWAGFVALLVLSIIDLVNIDHDSGRSSTEEALLVAFAAVAFVYTTVQFVWRLGFTWAASDLRGASMSDYNLLSGAKAH